MSSLDQLDLIAVGAWSIGDVHGCFGTPHSWFGERPYEISQPCTLCVWFQCGFLLKNIITFCDVFLGGFNINPPYTIRYGCTILIVTSNDDDDDDGTDHT